MLNIGPSPSTTVLIGAASFVLGWLCHSFFAKSKGGDMQVVGDISTKEIASMYNARGQLKMVLVVNMGLKMGKGKIAAQCCHGAVAAYREGLKKKEFKSIVKAWQVFGSAKVALKCDDTKMMHVIAKEATKRGLNCYVVQDAGRTQIAAGSHTVCAIGPAPVAEIDKLTGREGLFPLKLL